MLGIEIEKYLNDDETLCYGFKIGFFIKGPGYIIELPFIMSFSNDFNHELWLETKRKDAINIQNKQMIKFNTKCPKCGGTILTREHGKTAFVLFGFLCILFGVFMTWFIITLPIALVLWMMGIGSFIIAPFMTKKWRYKCLECETSWWKDKNPKKPNKPKKVYRKRKPSKFKLNKKDDNPTL